MKKLTVLLAAVMAFAFSATAYAATPSDLADQPVKVQDAFAKTMALGIINGYEDGSAGPTQNITRAEFAKIAVTAAGAKDTADMLANNASSFKDIKAGQWYTGWINAAESLGIFQGDGNGNFRPNDTITNQEVITVLMRLLGYNDNLNGTWPVNYVTQANKVEILDDVAVVAAAPATRADVVVMLDATLDANLVTYDKDTNEFVNKQTTKGGNSSVEISLLADSFKGAYVETNSFKNVDQIRDFAKQTLNWDVDGDTFIVDGETTVSYNGGSLFDLEGHAGKVYFVKDSDKLYARFVEVESYTKTVTDAPTQDGSKVKVNKTSYNADTDIKWTDNAGGKAGVYDDTVTPSKNSNYILYFNDDDQVYAVKSDKDFDEASFYVKDITSSTLKLVGSTNKTVSLSNDILVYTEDGFIDAADLTVGDAVQYVAEDLYVKVADVTGTLTKAQLDGTTIKKVTVDGKTYVAGTQTLLDKEYESSDAAIEDVYGNEVSYILNKNNTVAAMVVDETSTGTKLYGIVMGGDNTQNGYGSSLSSTSVTLFTSEGKSVTYDYDLDKYQNKLTDGDFAKLVEYKLTKDGDIKTVKVITESLGTGEIEVKNNAYLVGTETLTLASNVVIFEVDEDEEDLDPSIVTRSSLLAGGDFTPGELTTVKVDNTKKGLDAYSSYVLNTNGAIKVLAYTTAGTNTYHYGVVDGDVFSNSDYDNAIMLDGDETVYEWDNKKPTNHDLVVYTKSGDTLTIKDITKEKSMNAKLVTGYTDGLVVLDDEDEYFYFKDTNNTKVKDPIGSNNTDTAKSVMTDSETVVYVMNSSTGYFELGDLTSISKGSYVDVVIVDEDGYADLIIVDEYNDYNA